MCPPCLVSSCHVTSVVHLAGFIPAGAQFQPRSVRCLIYTDGFYMEAIHKHGKVSPRFPCEVFLGREHL